MSKYIERAEKYIERVESDDYEKYAWSHFHKGNKFIWNKWAGRLRFIATVLKPYLLERKRSQVSASHWPTYIRDAIKTGLESPTPYEVIPYKNGRGIKKIRFIKQI